MKVRETALSGEMLLQRCLGFLQLLSEDEVAARQRGDGKGILRAWSEQQRQQEPGSPRKEVINKPEHLSRRLGKCEREQQILKSDQMEILELRPAGSPESSVGGVTAGLVGERLGVLRGRKGTPALSRFCSPSSSP